MSDTGGPQDLEVAKLREQLAAAERLAELRTELQAAQDELAAMDADITQQEDAERSLSPAPNPHVANGSAPGTKGKPYAKIWLLRLVAIWIIGGVLTLVLLNTRGPGISITCPADSQQDANALEVQIGRNLNWVLSKIERVKVSFLGAGESTVEWFYDGYSPDSSYDDSKMDEAFRHIYRSPGTYSVIASVYDGNGRSAQDSCTFSWYP